MIPRYQLEQRAADLINEAGVEGEIPVPLEKIAAYLGFKTVGIDPLRDDVVSLKNFSGMIDYQQKQIVLNTSESTARQRFTLAHEIGHAVLHRNELNAIVDYRSELDNPSSDKERDANGFAAALLMPRDKFIPLWVKWKGNSDALAAIFGASKAAIEVRKKTTVDAGM